MKTPTRAFCPHCGKELTISTTDGYEWQCEYCDEDFYDFETQKTKTYIVKVIHLFRVEANNKDEAVDTVIHKDGYGESVDCYFEAEEE